uniref:Uncharacterized protein n=1 Tax=Anguilla anguilla TaxID=7936 RepID=A0A0E9UI98_ANGAN
MNCTVKNSHIESVPLHAKHFMKRAVDSSVV